MIKISTITGLGVLVAVLGTGFLGFPIEWKNFLYIVSGILIVVLSVLIRKELEKVLRHIYLGEVKNEIFSESGPKQQNMMEDVK